MDVELDWLSERHLRCSQALEPSFCREYSLWMNWFSFQLSFALLCETLFRLNHFLNLLQFSLSLCVCLFVSLPPSLTLPLSPSFYLSCMFNFLASLDAITPDVTEFIRQVGSPLWTWLTPRWTSLHFSRPPAPALETTILIYVEVISIYFPVFTIRVADLNNVIWFCPFLSLWHIFTLRSL